MWLKEQRTERVIVNSNVLIWKEKCCTNLVLHEPYVADLRNGIIQLLLESASAANTEN